MKKIIAKIIIIMIMVLTNSTINCGAQNQEKYIFLKGIETMVMGDKQTAKTIFQQIIKNNPQHTTANHYVAKILAQENNTAKALEHNTIAVKNDPNNFEYLKLQTLILLEQNNIKQALEILQQIRQTKHKQQKIYTLEIEILYQIKEYQKALKIAEMYEEIFGIDEDIIMLKYKILTNSNQIDKALEFMQKIVRKIPDNIEYNTILANIYAAIGQKNTALRIYNQTLKNNPQSIQAQLALANFHEITNNSTELINTLTLVFLNENMTAENKIEIFKDRFLKPTHYKNNTLKINQLITTLELFYPENTEVKNLYAQYLIYNGELNKALEKYQEITKLNQKNEEAYKQQIAILHYQKNITEALKIAQIYNQNINSLESQTTEILLLNTDKQTNSAIEKLNTVIKNTKIDSTKSNLITLKADILYENKQHKKAFKQYKNALKIYKQNPTALNNYAYFITLSDKTSKGKLQKALNMAEIACQIEPNNPTFLDTKAAVLFKMGETNKAYQIMTQVMEMDNNNSWEIVMRYADILFEMGDKIVAKKYWKIALERGAPKNDIENRLEKLNR